MGRGGPASLRRPAASRGGGPLGEQCRRPSEQIQFLNHHPSNSNNHLKPADCGIIAKPGLPCLERIWKKKVDCFLRLNKLNTLTLGFLRQRAVLGYYQHQRKLLRGKKGESFKQTNQSLSPALLIHLEIWWFIWGCLGNDDVRSACVCVCVCNPFLNSTLCLILCVLRAAPACAAIALWHLKSFCCCMVGPRAACHFLWMSRFDLWGVWKLSPEHLECDERICEHFSVAYPALLMGSDVCPITWGPCSPRVVLVLGKPGLSSQAVPLAPCYWQPSGHSWSGVAETACLTFASPTGRLNECVGP